jgi:hypothetical protein
MPCKWGEYLVLDRTPDRFWPQEPIEITAYHPQISEGPRTTAHTLPSYLDEDVAFFAWGSRRRGDYNRRALRIYGDAGGAG